MPPSGGGRRRRLAAAGVLAPTARERELPSWRTARAAALSMPSSRPDRGGVGASALRSASPGFRSRSAQPAGPGAGTGPGVKPGAERGARGTPPGRERRRPPRPLPKVALPLACAEKSHLRRACGGGRRSSRGRPEPSKPPALPARRAGRGHRAAGPPAGSPARAELRGRAGPEGSRGGRARRDAPALGQE